MKLAPALFAVLLVPGLAVAAAPDSWTYWIQPCNAETAHATRCQAGDLQLAVWALEAWEQASAGRIAMKSANSRDSARLRVFWAGGDLQLYGEARPIEVGGQRGAELYILPDLTALGRQIAAAGSGDNLYRDTIVYLTCLHESGHALGLPHNQDFEDIMYSFQYGGDIVEYFARYRRKLKVREDIRKNSGLNPTRNYSPSAASSIAVGRTLPMLNPDSLLVDEDEMSERDLPTQPCFLAAIAVLSRLG